MSSRIRTIIDMFSFQSRGPKNIQMKNWILEIDYSSSIDVIDGEKENQSSF